MTDLNKNNFLQTLPSVLANDEGMAPLGGVAAEALAGLIGKTELPAIYSRIDQLDEELLDILAKDFKVDWYDYDADITAKRAMIRDSFYVHRHLGTAGAVKRVLSDIYPSYTLQEWYEYGGAPYHFKVTVADNNFTAEKRAQAIRMINIVKNVRSCLDDIAAQTIARITVHVDTGHAFLDALVPGDDQLTNANDIADWEVPE